MPTPPYPPHTPRFPRRAQVLAYTFELGCIVHSFMVGLIPGVHVHGRSKVRRTSSLTSSAAAGRGLGGKIGIQGWWGSELLAPFNEAQ